LINFLPAYATPPNTTVEYAKSRHHTDAKQRKKGKTATTEQLPYSAESLPLPVTTKGHSRWPTLKLTPAEDEKASGSSTPGTKAMPQDPEIQTLYLEPSSNPPTWHVFDIWPFYHFIRSLQKTGERKLGGQRALRDRAQNQLNGAATDNVPLEITVYLSSYIAGLQQRGVEGEFNIMSTH
jgi:ion channel-forming bestrophin family protein